jgi:hypothetical protein
VALSLEALASAEVAGAARAFMHEAPIMTMLTPTSERLRLAINAHTMAASGAALSEYTLSTGPAPTTAGGGAGPARMAPGAGGSEV